MMKEFLRVLGYVSILPYTLAGFVWWRVSGFKVSMVSQSGLIFFRGPNAVFGACVRTKNTAHALPLIRKAHENARLGPLYPLIRWWRAL